jgi:hypothetical protein
LTFGEAGFLRNLRVAAGGWWLIGDVDTFDGGTDDGTGGIEHRLKNYTRCISKSTDNYLKYLMETYNRQLSQKLRMQLDD